MRIDTKHTDYYYGRMTSEPMKEVKDRRWEVFMKICENNHLLHPMCDAEALNDQYRKAFDQATHIVNLYYKMEKES